MTRFNKLIEVAQVMFKLGCFAFGGPAAHIAMLEEEVVEKRKWMTQEHFLDLIGATNLIPGPNSTEMTMHVGHERAGFWGLVIGGLSFIFPAVVITGILGSLYVAYGELPNIAPFIFGIKPAVLSVIFAAVLKLGKKAIKTTELGILGAITVALTLLGVNDVIALLITGLLGIFYFSIKNNKGNLKASYIPLMISTSSIPQVQHITQSQIFLTFLKVGAVLYGSGYVLFAYLDAELVQIGWLTRGELMDAIAIGQFTPGPVLSTATFIGYQLGGVLGAILATLGIFLPSFFLVFALNPFIPKLRSNKKVRYFLDSVNVAAVAIMGVVLVQMSMTALTDWKGILIGVLGFIITFGVKKANAMHIILGGSVLGYVLGMV
ncbi:chromate efflux transporter [Flammeovirga yaeyamensis]|uniref:Chromate efflux transporter n=1 Tax=Flammeovirga yaeyamensis TaxID=367791 RepID=A0AAX1N0S1_9BACT|nr:chromate efflux transporter [Flammeovirga yaeyamensis]MBB3698539.1 chromate transporter [Flammeovirga yaeyamensis]NMF34112.1 chromate efflux transporter [Flammeovirga yaeyamensis]QWG01099.1 chromate efflux transporter [Flammeovirga yaeyamensis]